MCVSRYLHDETFLRLTLGGSCNRSDVIDSKVDVNGRMMLIST